MLLFVIAFKIPIANPRHPAHGTRDADAIHMVSGGSDQIEEPPPPLNNTSRVI